MSMHRENEEKPVGREVAYFFKNTSQVEVREQSDSSVIWHEVKSFSRINPQTLCNMKKRKGPSTFILSLYHTVNHTHTHFNLEGQ